MLANAFSINPQIRGCQEAVQQMVLLVRALSPEQYARALGPSSSIGAHIRHSIDHFKSLFRGLHEATVDYDRRDRDPLIEVDPEAFFGNIQSILRALESLEQRDIDGPIDVRQVPAPGAEPRTTASTLGRELTFLSSHTIHHLAIMRILAELQGVSLPADFGLAYSTRAHRELVTSD